MPPGATSRGERSRSSIPLAPRFATIAAAAGADPGALARGFLGLSEVFGSDLPRDARFVEPLTDWLGSLITRGARATVAACIAR